MEVSALFDQTFSPENLQRIAERENRRGSNRDSSFFPNVKTKTDVLKEIKAEIRRFRKSKKTPYSAADQEAFNSLREKRELARSDRDHALLQGLEDVSKEISEKRYVVQFEKKMGPSGKLVYELVDAPTHYYAVKQISRNLSRLYKIKPSNRNLIISQLSDFLTDGFPYYIMKLDVSNFFENINQELLINKLINDQLLSINSLRLIKGILWKFSEISGTKGVGLPRGIGISSYLSELYMKDFDARISKMSEVVFYARYVDDIIIAFAPSKMSDTSNYIKFLTEKIEAKKLKFNSEKCIEIEVEKCSWSFEYLGYKFVKTSSKVETYLSDAKFKKFESRLRACFIRYHQQKAKNAKAAYRMLVRRVQYLTGNTRLSHSKQNAYVGIFFSSPYLTNLKQLKQLDGKLKGLTASLESDSLKTRLGKYSFVDGYVEKTYRRFHRKNEFKNIVKAWKYGK